MVIMEVPTVDCASLRGLLEDGAPGCLVLDCRSFLSFNSSHISGSTNVRFSTIVRRRARGGLGLEHIVPNEDTRSRLLSGEGPSGGPVEILPFLYLGSAYHASRKDMLDMLGITALINVSSNCPNHFEDSYLYKSIPVEDNHKADISSWFNEAIDFIDSVRNNGGRVFVHCQAGISRSATICLAYLMRTNRVKLDEAFEFVKQRRSIISPNFSFMGQLLQFESQVLASSSCSTEAGSPAIGNSNTVFNFPVSIPVHASAKQLSFLHSPITTSPSC
ncbi:unnamed protein product, partial [Tetraodon nigroviridis]